MFVVVLKHCFIVRGLFHDIAEFLLTELCYIIHIDFLYQYYLCINIIVKFSTSTGKCFELNKLNLKPWRGTYNLLKQLDVTSVFINITSGKDFLLRQ